MTKEMKITRSQIWADGGGWSNISHRKRFTSLFVASGVYGRTLSWRRTIPADNIPRRFCWIKESNYSMHSTFGRRHDCFRYVYGLTMRSELTSAMCDDWRVYKRHCATHLRKASSDSHCAVVLISRPIESWKKHSPRIYTFPTSISYIMLIRLEWGQILQAIQLSWSVSLSITVVLQKVDIRTEFC